MQIHIDTISGFLNYCFLITVILVVFILLLREKHEKELHREYVGAFTVIEKCAILVLFHQEKRKKKKLK